MTTTRQIIQVIFPGAQVLDITGPTEVFAQAELLLGSPGAYTLTLAAARPGPVPMSSGLRLCADQDFTTLLKKGPADTLLVPGGDGVYGARQDPDLLDFIREMSRNVRRTASVCSGTFLLAEAGLLSGRTATTHWSACQRLAAEYPDVRVAPDRIFVRDQAIYSSAGVTAGIDLALALVQADHGRELALDIAKQLVVFMKRQGGQSQFSSSLVSQAAATGILDKTLSWIRANPAQDLSITALAGRCAMSERNFARVFKRELGMTPGQFVEKLRVELATRQMETRNLGLEEIAEASGFKSSEMMRRAFMRQLKVLPHLYRSRFGI